MARGVAITLCFIVCGFAAAQSSFMTDPMGPHLNSGRGCTVCHTVHSPTIYDKDARQRVSPLWGETDLKAYGAGGRAYLTARTPERNGVLVCLSCHDGNYAPRAIMKGRIYESLPNAYGSYGSVPTLIGSTEVLRGLAFSDHPIGLETQVSCGGAKEWDCRVDKGTIVMDGPNSAKFVSAYGFFRKPHPYEGREVVVCTTCHNPHSRNAVAITKESESRAFHPGIYATISFLRAPYAATHASVSSNLSAQFCRQCHADLSNEMNGSSSGTVI